MHGMTLLETEKALHEAEVYVEKLRTRVGELESVILQRNATIHDWAERARKAEKEKTNAEAPFVASLKQAEERLKELEKENQKYLWEGGVAGYLAAYEKEAARCKLLEARVAELEKVYVEGSTTIEHLQKEITSLQANVCTSCGVQHHVCCAVAERVEKAEAELAAMQDLEQKRVEDRLRFGNRAAERALSAEKKLATLGLILLGSGRVLEQGLLQWLESQDADFKRDVQDNFVRPGLLKLREFFDTTAPPPLLDADLPADFERPKVAPELYVIKASMLRHVRQTVDRLCDNEDWDARSLIELLDKVLTFEQHVNAGQKK